jgi:hypothetical protein
MPNTPDLTVTPDHHCDLTSDAHRPETDSTRPSSSRRALLGGLALGAAAVAVDTVTARPAAATTDSPVIAGRSNQSSLPTGILNNTGGGGGDALYATGASTGGIGLVAYSRAGSSPAIKGIGHGNGVTGETVNAGASGVYGQNDGGGFGVAGRSVRTGGVGVLGDAGDGGRTGVLGKATAGDAVKGVSSTGNGVLGLSSSHYAGGVYGKNTGDGDGVMGAATSTAGSGVVGFGPGDGVFGQGERNGVVGRTLSGSGSGVYGYNEGAGFGVAGRSNDAGGTGVFGEALGAGGVALRGLSSGSGTALSVEGKAHFSRSGRALVAEGTRRATVVLADVSQSSIVLATMQMHVNGFVLESAVPTDGSIDIWLNKVAPVGGIPVAWQVLD